jgi:hypothetical protein
LCSLSATVDISNFRRLRLAGIARGFAMNFKLTLFLSVLLLAVVTTWALVKNRAAPVKTADAGQLLDPKPAITSISYTRFNNEELKFVKEGEEWNMVVPIKARASGIEGIAASLSNLTFRQKFEPEATGARSAESTGTAKPNYIIKFSDGKKDYTLSLGKQNRDSIFATLNGAKTVYILEYNPLDDFEKDVAKFRNTDIKSIDTSKVTQIAFKSKTAAWTVSKNKETSKWLLNVPISARVSEPAVQELLNQIQSIRANGFPNNLSKKDAGLDPPQMTLTASFQEIAPPATGTAPASAPALPPSKAPVTLEIGYASDLTLDRKDSPVYASIAGSDEVFILGNAAVKKINVEAKTLRDPAIIPPSVPVTGATDLILSTGGNPIVSASHKDSKWTLAGTPPLSGDPYALSDYLAVIRDLRAINYVDNVGDLKAIGLDPPRTRIELTLPGQSQHEVILVGNADTDPNGGKVTSILRQGEPTVYQVQTADAERLVTSLIALRDKRVDSIVADRIRKIEITGSDATVGIVPHAPAAAPATGTAPATATAPALTPGVTLVKDGTAWSVQKDGQTYVADETKISALLADFSPLSAARYLEDKPAQGTASITVTLTVLESALPAPATATAPAAPAATAAASAPASAAAPATSIADILPPANPVTVDPGKMATYTLTLYKVEAPATASAPAAASQPAATWKAAWSSQTPAWSFEPPAYLIEHVTKATYNAGPASTQATTKPFAGL